MVRGMGKEERGGGERQKKRKREGYRVTGEVYVEEEKSEGDIEKEEERKGKRKEEEGTFISFVEISLPPEQSAAAAIISSAFKA